MTVADETQPVREGDLVYVERGKPHSLTNTGESDLHMMFVYAPKMVVDHWAQEQSGTLRNDGKYGKLFRIILQLQSISITMAVT